MMMEICRVRIYEEDEEIDRVANMFRENFSQHYRTIYYKSLQKYDLNNEHFSMEVITKNEEEQEELVITYHCIYRYKTHEIKLKYDTSTETWEIVCDKYSPEEEKQLNAILFDLENFQSLTDYTLDEQIQIMIKDFDHYFLEVEEAKRNQIAQNESSLHQTPTTLTIPEDDEQQKDGVNDGLHSSFIDSRPKFSDSAPPPVVPRRSRQNSACSTQSSVRYVSFIPQPTAPVRPRRVIESILLHVQRKKKTFEKIVDVLKGREPPTMYELGLEFLRVYDGKFNYRDGHTFVMSYRKKTWFLRIERIKCVDCPVGDSGPRSELILSYKGRYTSVHI